MNPILVIAGTNRPGSNTLKVATRLMQHYAAASIAAELFSLTDMPAEIFDSSSYAKKPESWHPISKRVLDATGLHIITPEYNGSFPGVLKYFIDMLKFPESFERKPVAFAGVAAGLFGALRPIEHLMQIFSYRNAYLYPDRVFIPTANKHFDEAGKLVTSEIDQRLEKQAHGFAEFVARFK